MNLKKFISGVSAIAIAASAFAAMAVTASADTTYTDVAAPAGNSYKVSAQGSGTYKPTSAKAFVVADFSSLPGIDEATTVTVQFETAIEALSNGNYPSIIFGVGDKKVRGNNVENAITAGYNRDNLVTYFGSTGGTNYSIHKKGNIAQSVFNASGKVIHASITLDRTTGNWEAEYSGTGMSTQNTSGTVAVGTNLTVAEAYTYGVTAETQHTFAFRNYKITYTVPATDVDVSNNATVTGTDGTATIVKTSYDGDGTIDTLTITATPVGGVEDTKTFERGKDYTFDTVFSGAAVDFSVFVKGVESVSSIAIN